MKLDEAFPLKTYRLRPYLGRRLESAENKMYKYRHCLGRRVVVDTFGILSQKFRIYNRRIQANPENVYIIILTTCILHNFIEIYDDKFVYPRDKSTNPAETTTKDKYKSCKNHYHRLLSLKFESFSS